MASFTAAITGMGHSRTGNLRDRFGRGLAKSDNMAFPDAVGALQFTAGAVVVERTFGTFGQIPTVSFWRGRCGCSGGSMDRHDLLVLGGGLSFLAFLLIRTLPLFVRWIWWCSGSGGCCCWSGRDFMVDQTLGQFLGAIEGGRA